MTSTAAEGWVRREQSVPTCRRPRHGTRRQGADRYLRAVQARESRGWALALVPFYAGRRIAETVALDVDDVRLSARKGVLRVLARVSACGRSRSIRSCARR